MQILCTKKFLSVFPSSPQQQLKSGLQVSTLALSGDKPGTYMYWGKVYIIKGILTMTYLFNIYLEAVLFRFKFRLHKFEQLSVWFTVSKWTFCIFEVALLWNVRPTRQAKILLFALLLMLLYRPLPSIFKLYLYFVLFAAREQPL